MNPGRKTGPQPGTGHAGQIMPPPEMLKSLETLAKELRVALKYEDGEFQGGLCRIRGESMIILPRQAPAEEKIELLAEGLSHFDVDDVYVIPLVRDLLDNIRQQRMSA